MMRLRTNSLSLPSRLFPLLATVSFLLLFAPASPGGTSSITSFSGVVTTLSTGSTSKFSRGHCGG